MSVTDKLMHIINLLPEEVKLVLVTKHQPLESIKEAYDAGQRIMGENKVQDLISKQPKLPSDIEWHFIGHLQTNKVKFIAPFVKLIHSVDSLKLFREINKEAIKNNRIIDCLFEFHIAQEESKYGLSYNTVTEIIDCYEFKELKNIRICGVMGMASFTKDTSQIQEEFRKLRQIFDYLKTNYFAENDFFKEISMGMSDDFQIAIAEGSTIVRIGSAVFKNP
ncbi:MAG: YggS family pyridoxal phosphate-dependent enzyme [Bacteroidales bacterium]|nr:YggS family pyridoxal phosphate-dependent enzyme [Bacteroidales bacterium]